MFLILGLILTFLLGFFFTLLVAPKLGRWEQMALGWVIGLGFVTQELFLLSIFNINYSKISVLGPLFVSNLILGFLARKRFNLKFQFKPSRSYLFSQIRFWFEELSSLEQILIMLLLILVLGAFIRAIFWPVFYWDALALYDYRAKIFFDAKGIAESMALTSIPLHGAPPMTSLAHTFIYILGGKNANPQFIYATFYLVLLVVFYTSIRTYCKRWISLLFTFFLASIPFFVEFAANAYTNLPYALYFGMGTVYLMRFLKEREWGLLIMAGVLMGLAGWTRAPTEQFFLINLIILVIWSLWMGKYFFAPLVLLLLFTVLALPWRAYVALALYTPSVGEEFTSALSAGVSMPWDFERFSTVVVLLLKSIKGVSGTSLVLAFFVTTLFPKMALKNFFPLLFIVGNFLVFVIGSYVFSLSWIDWQNSIENSAHRLSMFLPPFVLFYAAISVPYFLKSKEKKL